MKEETTVQSRGQLHTLEGFTALVIILTAILFSLQAVSVTPTASSTASQVVETKNVIHTDDLLAASAADGSLEEAILNFSEGDATYAESNFSFYEGADPPGEFGDVLDQRFSQRGIVYNLEIFCEGNEDGKTLVDKGGPSSNAVSASHYIILHDDDTLTHNDNPNTKLENAGRFQSNVCPQTSSGSSLYNVVEVRITAWRM